MKRLLSIVLAILMIGSMLPAMAMTSFAFNTPNDIKSVALTLEAPKAGATVDNSNSSVTVDTPMDYKVIGVHWYKGNELDYSDDRLGFDDNDTYFIGNYSYTVKIELAVKGNKTWNFEYVQGEPVYHINATVNGQAATVSARELNHDAKIICVTYKFENIPVGEITPYVRVATPIAGQTKDDVIVAPYNERQMSRSSWSEDCNWYHRVGGEWVAMDDDDIFMTGKDYRLIATFYTHEGFRFSASGTHTIGDDGYIYGYVNGRQMSMKLTKIAGEYQYDHPVTLTYDIVSCKAQELGSVSFEGIQAPVAGQHPQYAVTMGDSTYSLVTDDAVSGGAEYGFVNGLAWKLGYGTPLTAQSTFEQGAYYTLSFFIRSDDIYRFTDFVTGSANVGYVEVVPMFDDPTLAFVTVDFAPCGGGVMNTVNVGGFREPVHGASPDGNLLCGQGYEKYGELQWFEVNDSGERAMSPNDAFTYGNQYKVVMVLKTTDGFTFAARSALTVNVNGKAADMLAGVANEAESEYVTVVKYFDCGAASIGQIGITVDTPVEGNNRSQQIAIDGLNYSIEGFMIVDSDTGVALKPDDIYAGAKLYDFICVLSAAEGYKFDEGTVAKINGQEAYVVSGSDGEITVMMSFLSEELPYYNVEFTDGNGGSVATGFITKAGIIVLPEYEAIVPDGMKFVGWTLDGGMTVIGGEYYVTNHTEFVAVLVEESVHKHVYDNKFIDDGQGMHYRQCIDEDCPDIMSSVIDQGQHQYVNMDPCEMECMVCGHVRNSDVGFGYHNYAYACSEVCPTCGQERETTHTPGAAATCTEPQKCTVCAKVLVNALGHTPGEAANCGHAQTCTVCSAELAPIQGEHVPGAAATCTAAQTCTVCGTEIAAATGHAAGVEWISDETGHWHVCATCNGEAEKAEHVNEDGDNLCDVCGYKVKGLGVGAIIGIVIGAVVVLGVGGFAIFWFVIKKKNFADLKKIFKKN